MQFLPNLPRRRKTAYGLIIVLLALAILTLVFASLLSLSSANSQITVRNNLFNQSENAAESATENIMAYMMRDFQDGNLGAASTYATLFPPTNGWPIYYAFSCTNGDPDMSTNYAASVWIGDVSTAATNLNSQFSGLYGFVQPCVIASTATPLGQGQNLSATIYQAIQFARIPLFQYAIFYNMDLEINPGAGMTVNGRVHSNNTIWATGAGSGSSLLTFTTNVEAATGIFYQRSTNDPSPQRYGNVFFVYSNSINPDPNANVMTLPIGSVTGNNNPTNVASVLNPPPAGYGPPYYTAAYNGPGSNYLENEADLIVSNPATGLAGTMGANILVYYQNPNNSPNYLTQVLPDILVSSNVTPLLTNVYYAGYSFVTNVSFYDYRESAIVQALQINVGALNTWLTNSIHVGSSNSAVNYIFQAFGVTNHYTKLGGRQYNQLNTVGSTSKSHSINSIYVYNNVQPISGSQLPAVRMFNGQQLPTNGLTVVTPQPMYVEGDYNTTTNGLVFSRGTLGDTTNTYPAGLFADAVTILSSNWSDAYNSSTTLASRAPVDTTINAATLEGIVPSNGLNYSGGVENFLRLLENWGGTLTYNGSIVVMFPSQYATSPWQQTGHYYNAPTRNWGFDLNFNQSTGLPPLTPQVKQTVRGSWSAW
ncbi:MAG: hypothetical protein ABSE48_12525 [Verrucomicrobiota bacterium]